jgi:hypothetical protein
MKKVHMKRLIISVGGGYGVTFEIACTVQMLAQIAGKTSAQPAKVARLQLFLREIPILRTCGAYLRLLIRQGVALLPAKR